MQPIANQPLPDGVQLRKRELIKSKSQRFTHHSSEKVSAKTYLESSQPENHPFLQSLSFGKINEVFSNIDMEAESLVNQERILTNTVIALEYSKARRSKLNSNAAAVTVQLIHQLSQQRFGGELSDRLILLSCSYGKNNSKIDEAMLRFLMKNGETTKSVTFLKKLGWNFELCISAVKNILKEQKVKKDSEVIVHTCQSLEYLIRESPGVVVVQFEKLQKQFQLLNDVKVAELDLLLNNLSKAKSSKAKSQIPQYFAREADHKSFFISLSPIEIYYRTHQRRCAPEFVLDILVEHMQMTLQAGDGRIDERAETYRELFEQL